MVGPSHREIHMLVDLPVASAGDQRSVEVEQPKIECREQEDQHRGAGERCVSAKAGESRVGVTS